MAVQFNASEFYKFVRSFYYVAFSFSLRSFPVNSGSKYLFPITPISVTCLLTSIFHTNSIRLNRNQHRIFQEDKCTLCTTIDFRGANFNGQLLRFKGCLGQNGSEWTWRGKF